MHGDNRRIGGSWLRLVSFLLAASVVGLALPQRADATSIKLSPTPPIGSVRDFQISPDGRYVVYIAEDGVGGMYSVPLNGGAATRLDVAYGGSSVGNFEISPDSKWVVYDVMPSGGYGGLGLYSVPITGPATSYVRLNGRLAPSGYVGNHRITPDGSQVVYVAWQEESNGYQLYRVPLTGPASAAVALSEPLLAMNPWEILFQLSPDGSRAIYYGYLGSEWGLYSVPLAGQASDSIRLSDPQVTPNLSFISPSISPDSARVVYKGIPLVGGSDELYSVPITGPASVAVKLYRAPEYPPGYWPWLADYRISADGRFVVYLLHLSVVSPTGEYYYIEQLYSAPIAGPAEAAVKIAEARGGGQGGGCCCGSSGFFKISSDSARVVYAAPRNPGSWLLSLYSVSIVGPAGAAVLLSLDAGTDASVCEFEISQDSSRVIYSDAMKVQGAYVNRLYSVPIAGPASASIELNGSIPSGGSVSRFLVSEDSRWVAYLADRRQPGVYELYSVPTAGPAASSVRLSSPLVGGSGVGWLFAFSPDGNHVLYMASEEVVYSYELYRADTRELQVSFRDLAVPVLEDAGTVSLTVELTEASALPVSVDYAVVSGSATGGGIDYTLNPGTLTFAPGEMSKTLPISITNDGLLEPTEMVVVALSNPANATLGAITHSTVIIRGTDRVSLPILSCSR